MAMSCLSTSWSHKTGNTSHKMCKDGFCLYKVWLIDLDNEFVVLIIMYTQIEQQLALVFLKLLCECKRVISLLDLVLESCCLCFSDNMSLTLRPLGLSLVACGNLMTEFFLPSRLPRIHVAAEKLLTQICCNLIMTTLSSFSFFFFFKGVWVQGGTCHRTTPSPAANETQEPGVWAFIHHRTHSGR